MPKILDLAGQTFGKLLVESFACTKGNPKNSYWNCICQCGKLKIISAKHLKDGSSNVRVADA